MVLISDRLQKMLAIQEAIYAAKTKEAALRPEAFNEVEQLEWQLRLWNARLELAKEEAKP